MMQDWEGVGSGMLEMPGSRGAGSTMQAGRVWARACLRWRLEWWARVGSGAAQ